MRTKTDDQSLICIANDEVVKEVYLIAAMVGTVGCQAFEQDEFITYESGVLQKEV